MVKRNTHRLEEHYKVMAPEISCTSWHYRSHEIIWNEDGIFDKKTAFENFKKLHRCNCIKKVPSVNPVPDENQ